jgi:hypothetical protein
MALATGEIESEGGKRGVGVDELAVLRLVLWPVGCQRRQLYSSSSSSDNVHDSRRLEGRE